MMTIAEHARQVERHLKTHGYDLYYLEDEIRKAFNAGQNAALDRHKIPHTLTELEEEGLKR